MVAAVCEKLRVVHSTLTVEWDDRPQTGIQQHAREARYACLARWAQDRGLDAIATAHHGEDQAETVLMRLNRGAGVRGLAAMRPRARVPGHSMALLRPLLAWQRRDLESVCRMAGIAPADDPSNRDARFERARIRKGMAEAQWLDAQSIARSASNLADADSALDWAAGIEWDRQVTSVAGGIVYRPLAPAELRRRVLERVIGELASEGHDAPLRGREIDQLMAALSDGETVTLRGILCSGGEEWQFGKAPGRRSKG